MGGRKAGNFAVETWLYREVLLLIQRKLTGGQCALPQTLCRSRAGDAADVQSHY